MIGRSILAGVFISVGAICYLNNPNLIGAILFSIGIMAVIALDCPLYTGKIGFINKNNYSDLCVILICNLIGAFGSGIIYGLCASDEVYATANNIIVHKLHQPYLTQFIMGIGCGICIYLCVLFYQKFSNPVLIALPIVVFIMSGYNHCIADTFYYAVYGKFNSEFIMYLIRVIAGNSIGSIVVHQILKNTKISLDI
mgnify:FL=1